MDKNWYKKEFKREKSAENERKIRPASNEERGDVFVEKQIITENLKSPLPKTKHKNNRELSQEFPETSLTVLQKEANRESIQDIYTPTNEKIIQQMSKKTEGSSSNADIKREDKKVKTEKKHSSGEKSSHPHPRPMINSVLQDDTREIGSLESYFNDGYFDQRIVPQENFPQPNNEKDKERLEYNENTGMRVEYSNSVHINIPVTRIIPGRIPKEIEDAIPLLTEKVSSVHIHIYHDLNRSNLHSMNSSESYTFHQYSKNKSSKEEINIKSTEIVYGKQNHLENSFQEAYRTPVNNSINHINQMTSLHLDSNNNGLVDKDKNNQIPIRASPSSSTSEKWDQFEFHPPHNDLTNLSYSKKFSHYARRKNSMSSDSSNIKRNNLEDERNIFNQRALIVGIEYAKNENVRGIKGCSEDVFIIYRLLREIFNFEDKDIVILCDVRTKIPDIVFHGEPNRRNILNALNLLVYNSKPSDRMWFSYSGHGIQVPDMNHDEKFDNMDEALIPSDFDPKLVNHILDDDLHNIVTSICCGSTLTSLIDSCHAGTMLDLPFDQSVLKSKVGGFHKDPFRFFHMHGKYQVEKSNRNFWQDKPLSKEKPYVSTFKDNVFKKCKIIEQGIRDPLPDNSKGLVVQFAACYEGEESKSIYTCKRTGTANGAMTLAFVHTIKSFYENHTGKLMSYLSYKEILKQVLAQLKSYGMIQTPHISSSHVISLDDEFRI